MATRTETSHIWERREGDSKGRFREITREEARDEKWFQLQEAVDELKARARELGLHSEIILTRKRE